MLADLAGAARHAAAHDTAPPAEGRGRRDRVRGQVEPAHGSIDRGDHDDCPTDPVDDARLAEILANPGFGTHFTDHMFTVEWTPERGLARRADHAVRPADARPRDRGPALRAGDLRGHEGLPPRRRLDLDLPPRGERRADGALRAAAGLPRAAGRGLRAGRRRPGRASTSAGCPTRRGEKSLYLRPFMFATETFLGVRPAQHVTFMVIASPGRRLLQGRRQAGRLCG